MALEQQFNEEMRNIYVTAKKELKYNATRFLQLLSEKGGIAAAKQLIAKDGGTYGFEILWERKVLCNWLAKRYIRPLLILAECLCGVLGINSEKDPSEYIKQQGTRILRVPCYHSASIIYLMRFL